MRWVGMRWDATGCIGMGCVGMGCDAMGCVGMGWDGHPLRMEGKPSSRSISSSQEGSHPMVVPGDGGRSAAGRWVSPPSQHGGTGVSPVAAGSPGTAAGGFTGHAGDWRRLSLNLSVPPAWEGHCQPWPCSRAVCLSVWRCRKPLVPLLAGVTRSPLVLVPNPVLALNSRGEMQWGDFSGSAAPLLLPPFLSQPPKLAFWGPAPPGCPDSAREGCPRVAPEPRG